METPLRGRSGGHTGAAPTISRVASCPKVAGRGSADGQIQEMVGGRGSADGLKREMIAGEVLADGLKREMIAGEVLADGLSVWFIAGKGFVRRDDSKMSWQTGLCRRDDGAAKRCSAAR